MQTITRPSTHRTAAARESAELERAFGRRRGWRAGGPHACLDRLVGGRCRGACPRPGWLDHGQLWFSGGRVAGLTSEPYGLTTNDVTDLLTFADRHALRLTIGAESWYYPGSTVLVVLERPTPAPTSPDALALAEAHLAELEGTS